MPRESHSAKKKRVESILSRLKQTYPEAHCELFFRNPLELLIATILSAQCSDRQVNVVTPALFAKYPSPEAYASVPVEELAHDIRSIGLYRSKAKNIQACCRQLVERFRSEVPKTMAELIELEGVGRKTANVVLGNAFGISEGIVVDTHVARLSQRLGLSKQTAAEKIETDLQRLVPPPDWSLVSHLLIWHGRRRCDARKPDCANCEIRQLCPSMGKIIKLQVKHG